MGRKWILFILKDFRAKGVLNCAVSYRIMSYRIVLYNIIIIKNIVPYSIVLYRIV